MYIRFTVYRRNENSRAVRDSFREKKKREKKIHTGVELYVKSDTACSESGCATAFPRFPCRNFSRQFVYEGGKRVRGGVFSSPLPPLPPPPRNFFNIRIRVGPPTRAQSLPRRRRLSLFRVRERNFSSRKTKPSPIGSIFHSRSQGEETKVRITFQRLINSFSSVSRLNDSSRDSCNLFWSLFLSLSEIVSFFLIERGVGKRTRLENEREKKKNISKSFLWERTFLLVGPCVLPLAKNANFPTVGTKVCVF